MCWCNWISQGKMLTGLLFCLWMTFLKWSFTTRFLTPRSVQKIQICFLFLSFGVGKNIISIDPRMPCTSVIFSMGLRLTWDFLNLAYFGKVFIAEEMNVSFFFSEMSSMPDEFVNSQQPQGEAVKDAQSIESSQKTEAKKRKEYGLLATAAILKHLETNYNLLYGTQKKSSDYKTLRYKAWDDLKKVVFRVEGHPRDIEALKRKVENLIRDGVYFSFPTKICFCFNLILLIFILFSVFSEKGS